MITNQQRNQAGANATPIQIALYSTPEAGRQLRVIAKQHNITDLTEYGLFAIAAGDVVLKLVTPAELSATLTELLPKLSPEVVANLAQAIVNFAAPALLETPEEPAALSPIMEKELEKIMETLAPDEDLIEFEAILAAERATEQAEAAAAPLQEAAAAALYNPQTQTAPPTAAPIVSAAPPTAAPTPAAQAVEPPRTMEGDVNASTAQGDASTDEAEPVYTSNQEELLNQVPRPTTPIPPPPPAN